MDSCNSSEVVEVSRLSEGAICRQYVSDSQTVRQVIHIIPDTEKARLTRPGGRYGPLRAGNLRSLNSVSVSILNDSKYPTRLVDMTLLARAVSIRRD